MKIDVLKVVDDGEPIVPNRISGITNINCVELMLMLPELETKELVKVEIIGKNERFYQRLVYKKRMKEQGSYGIKNRSLKS